MAKKPKTPAPQVESLSPPPLHPLELLRQRVEALGLMQEGLLAKISRQLRDENWINNLSRDAEEAARQLRKAKPTKTSEAQAAVLLVHAANMCSEWEVIKHDERLRVAVRTVVDLTLAMAQANADMHFAQPVRKQQAAVETRKRATAAAAVENKRRGDETAEAVITETPGNRAKVSKRTKQRARKRAQAL